MECRELETVLPDCDMDEYPEVETQEEVLRHLKMFTASSVLKTLNERNISFEDALRRRQIFTQAMARNQQELAYRQRLIQLHKRYLSGEPDAEQYPSDGDSEQLLDAEVNQFVPSSHSSHFTTSQTYQPTDSGRFTHLNML
ncbi:uncharacterized protein [Watersipora subatra]|uniref:uncharacterized protein n=1 Tax=Watersipora subatra TaxID=2589382 RepID=UPI00355C553D